MTKQRILSVTKNDLVIESFRAGGKGGQNVNKVNSGIRITHPASGAVGRAVDSRDQPINKKLAFKRMTESKEFQAWLKIETAKISGVQDAIGERVEREMKRIKVEIKNEQGQWAEEEEGPNER